jgi:hypothetical protein
MTASPASLISPLWSFVVSASLAHLSPASSISSVTVALAGQACAELRDRGKPCRERPDTRRCDRIREGLAEISRHQHAVREGIGKSGLLGEVDVDMDWIVIARGAAIEREPVAGDRRKLLVDDTFADRRLSCTHDALSLRTTTVREASATCTPSWLVTAVSNTTSVIAPPFFSVTLARRGLNVRVSPITTGAY